MTKYIIEGPIVVSFDGEDYYYEDGAYAGSDERERSSAGPEHLDAIANHPNMQIELAEYIWEDESIHGVVTEIYPGVYLNHALGEVRSQAQVTTTRRLNDEEKAALIDYLSGQYSDGWGEEFEQQELKDDRGNCFYASFWERDLQDDSYTIIEKIS